MKKFLKIVAIFFTSLIILFAIFLLYIYSSNNSFLESENDINITYLKQNSVSIDQAINEKLFDRDFYNSQVFL